MMLSEDVIGIYEDSMERQNAGKDAEKAASYQDAARYSVKSGNALSDAVTAALRGLDDITEDEADMLLHELLRTAYKDNLSVAALAQRVLNQRARIGMKAAEVGIDEDRIVNYIRKLASAPLAETGFLAGRDACRSFTRSAVTGSIEENAQMQREAGLESYIERYGYGCCAWCDSMCGKFVYGEQPKDFFRIHKDCTCEINFRPARQRWTRTTYSTDEKGRLKKTIDYI